MKDEIESAYRSPAETDVSAANDVDRPLRQESLSKIGLAMSSIGLLVPAMLATLAVLNIIRIPWDSILLPGTTFLICLPLSVAGFIVSVIARMRYRTRRATIGIRVALIAIPVCLAATWLPAMAGLASCPI